MKPRPGFTTIFMLIVLPLIFLSLTGLARLLAELEVRGGFRHLCLLESLKLQKDLIASWKTNPAAYAGRLNPAAGEIRKHLEILAPGRTRQLKPDPAGTPSGPELVFELQGALICGARLRKEGEWRAEIIYESKTARF